jgi:RNA polymerase sigma-70 factor (ECF subfamily)
MAPALQPVRSVAAPVSGETRALDAAIAGEGWAVEELLLRVAPRVRNLARYLTRGDDEADDVAQDALSIVYRKLSSYRREGAFNSWVDRIVLHTALSYKRTSGRRGETPLEEDEMAQAAEPIGDYLMRRTMAKALDALPNDQRHALVLHYIMELSVPEISAELGARQETVRSRLRLGRSKLRALLGERSEHDSA